MRIIGGKMRGKKLVSPETEATRPTSDRARESLFNILDNDLRLHEKSWADVVFADVFAGTGAVGIEALSRGAKFGCFFEIDKGALKSLRQNLSSLEKQSIILGDALNPPRAESIMEPFARAAGGRGVPIESKAVDILFMDAPYGRGLWEQALIRFDRQGWINADTHIIIEIDKSENGALPSGFDLSDKRAYGRNTFLFVRKN